MVIHHLNMIDIVQVADMCESNSTYVNDECVDNHDYDDDTDDDNEIKKIAILLLVLHWPTPGQTRLWIGAVKL